MLRVQANALVWYMYKNILAKLVGLIWIYTVFTGVFNLFFLQLCIEYLALITLV